MRGANSGGGNMATRRAVKPEYLTYGADELPPLRDLILGGLQQAALIVVSLIVPLLIGHEANLSHDDLQRYLTVSLVAVAIANLFMPFRLGPVGCGYLVPVYCAAMWITPALTAVKAGGLPLVAGMTVSAGVVMIAAAWALPRLRPYFPAELSGLVILIIGLDVSLAGLQRILQPISTGVSPGPVLATAGATLGLAIALRVWGVGGLSSYAVVISIVAGSLIGIGSGLTAPETLAAIGRAPILALPNLAPFGLAFDASIALPFVVTALASAIGAIGDATNAQKINNEAWIRPDMLSIRGATIGVGLGMIVMGLLGSSTLATSSAAVGLTRATGNASRYVALAMSAALAVAALSPLVVTAITTIPTTVIGATWLLLGGFIIVAGVEIITSRLLDTRRSIVIGLALPIGLSAQLFPAVYADLPAVLKPLAGSTLALGTVSALVLNAIFRIGVRRRATLVVEAAAYDPDAITAFLARQGAQWAARREVISKANFALLQLLELIRDHRAQTGRIGVAAVFDEFNLRIEATYSGAPIVFPQKRPTARELVADETAVERLAGFLIRQSADSVEVGRDGERTRVRLGFEH